MLIVLTELLWSRLQGDYQTGRPHVFVCRFEAVIVIFSLPLPLCLSICLFVITAIASISSIAACVCSWRLRSIACLTQSAIVQRSGGQ